MRDKEKVRKQKSKFVNSSDERHCITTTKEN